LVRGFALTLAIGILVSMFSAIVVTRTFLRLIYRR
jgi:preprotein translocase subunit SecD